MKRVAFLLAMLLPATALAQAVTSWQEWTDNQVAQDMVTLAPYRLVFPRGFAGIPTVNASISMLDNSGAVYEAQAFSGTGAPRFSFTTSSIFNYNGGSFYVVDASVLGGTAQVILNQRGLSGSTEEQFRQTLVGPNAASTSQTTPFFYLGVMHGAPTGVPIGTTNGGAISEVPIVFDDVHQEFWWYSWIGAAWNALGSGSGTVTAVSATDPLFITGGSSPTPNVVGHGLIVSGDTVTSGQDLGSIATSMLACSTSAGVCTVDGVTVNGGLNFNASSADLSLGSFTCGAGQFVNASTTSGLSCTTPAGGGTVTSVTGANGVVCSPTSPNPTCTLANATCGANQFVSSASTGSGLVCTQPAFSNLSGALACSQLPAFTGAATSTGGTCATTVNFTGLTGSASCAQLPALTGDATTVAGTCGTSVVAVEAGANMKGAVLWSGSSTPSTPTGTNMDCFNDAANTVFSCIDNAANRSSLMQAYTCASHKFANFGDALGDTICAQPAFTDVSGSLACSQLPVLTGADGIASAGGTCTVTNAFKGKVSVSGGDTPDVLSTKVVSAGGTISVTSISGGSLLAIDVASGIANASLNYNYLDAQLNGGFGGLWAIAGANNSSNGDGNATEYCKNVAATSVTITANTTLNSLSGLLGGTVTFQVTRNGTAVSGAIITIADGTTGVVRATGTVSGGAVTDTYGVLPNTPGGNIPFGVISTWVDVEVTR